MRPAPCSLLALIRVLGGCATDDDASDLSLEDLADADGDGKADGVMPGCAAARGGDHFEFLDDVCKKKTYPSRLDREHACPVTATSASPALPDGRLVHYRPATGPVEVDDEALTGIVPSGLDVTVILVRRIAGVPHYRYLSNGSHADTFQPWSSTKFMAIANAAAALRSRSSYQVGLTAEVGRVSLGDLVTVVHSYDEREFSSNGLARYFHNIGGRREAQKLVSSWLARPGVETFGGNYGVREPALGYAFAEASGATISMIPDTTSGPANHLSTFTLAEFLKRLVMHREDAATRLPGIQWADLKTLFYGAERSRAYTSGWGGMSADPSIYVHAGVPMSAVEQRSRGTWRVFGKLGFGKGEFVHVSYACLPALDVAGAPIPDVGKELIIATRLAAGGTSWAERDALLARHYRAILSRVYDGRLK
jgi:hypothetical protein